MIRSAAIVTIHGAGSMTPKGRRDIAKWLQQQAEDLLKHGKDYTDTRFTARYRYDTEETPRGRR